MDTLKETLLSFTGLFEYAYGANPETGEVGVLLNITYTPGERIARAYLTGNTYGLSAEETKALSEAKKLIGSKEFVSASIEDKERRIHDYICEKTTYYRGDDSAAVARHETALGIMLDGRGNCMAYTDAFLMLCKMAGFRVYAVGGTAFGGSEWEEHAWNIIKVDGEWVYADVTYDDAVGEGVSRSYEYYNVTAEKLSENHVWDMELTDKLITLWENIDDSVNN
ncbi:MAG: hypothetical protein LBD16_00935 [Oscillospiraceae bacterium]|nr:hypothetical protein [Oscillospiraceae bacterium]